MNLKTILYFLFVVLLLPVTVFSQIKDRNLNNVDNYKEFFYLDPLVFSSKDSLNARLDLYIQLPLENIQFKRNTTTEKYDAFIDYTIVIKNSLGGITYNNTFSETMSNTESEQKKVTEKSVYAVKQFFLQPDKYKLNFSIKDKNSQKEYTKDYEFTVKDFGRKKILFSDIMLVSNYKEDEAGQKEIFPLVNNNVGNLKDFYLFFEVYNRLEDLHESGYYYRVVDEKNKTVIDGNYSYYLDSGVTKKVEKLNTNLLVIGNYKFEILDKLTNEVVAAKNFYYRWDFLPVSMKNLDLAISQLVYIATSKELSYIKDAATRDEKERRFLKFWKDKDPSPATAKNELLIEYYNRIKIANERYSHYTDGWKTDMGMVYIIYGNPSNIERHPFESDTKPYEIWEYYDLKKRFIFVDHSGFGDYRLTSPIWDEEGHRIYY